MVVDNDSFLSQGHVPKFAFAEDGGRDSEEVDFTSKVKNYNDTSYMMLD